MKTNLLQRKRLLTEESNRCYLCDAPVCTKACKPGLDPGRLLRACKMDNLAGAILRAYQMEACRDCDGHPCEKACLRGRTDRAISITQIVRQLQDMPNPTDSSPLTSSPDLAIDFCGIRCANPFILASSPVAHNYEICVRALEAGWAGICFKTISFYPSHEVSPRFDQMEVDGVPFIGFKNMEQLSEASVEENFDTLYRLKQRYPDKLIISSIMGRTDDEWTRLAQYSTQAGADIIECNFSCPQMTQEGMGSDVGQSPELVRRFTAATRRGTHLPILAKMTPNIGQMTPVALAAHEGGATGIAAINSIKCITRIDEKALTARPVVCGLSSVSGYSGKAVRPIALRFIHELASDPSAGKMPISGIGGIETWRDALDFLLLGCTNLLQRKRLLTEESNRCYLCDAPVCTKACKPGLDPGRLLRACKMDNLAGAILRAYQMEACRDCDGHPCEKACLRGRTDRAISITQIVRQLQDMPNPTDSSPLTSSPDLAIDFCGIRCANPFILASSPVAHNYEICVRALEAGWAGICFKTISFYPSHEVSPRFDQMEVDGVPFIGFKNMEQLSEASVEENFDTLYRLKQRYPDKLIISSIMGRTDDEWTRLAQYSTQAGADIIECNFSCPQMTQEGMGSDVGQSPELVRRFTAATRRGTHLPILAKMTPNIGQMTPVALAAHEGGATGIAAINSIKCITRIDEKALTARPVVCGLSSVSGYSGKAVRPIALRFIHELASDPSAGKMPISGIGGIETWRDALDFLLLGCTNLQICTAVMQYGFRIIDDLCEGLRLFMQENGYKTLSDLIGIALPNIVPPEKLERTQIHRPTVDNSLCLGCGRCFVSCNDGGHQAIRFTSMRKPVIDEQKCVGCHLCALVCPTFAIH